MPAGISERVSRVARVACVVWRARVVCAVCEERSTSGVVCEARARRARAMVKDSRDAIGTLTLERVCRLRDAGTRSENARARDRCSESEHRGGEERRSNASVFARAKGEMKTRRRARRLTFS